MVMECFEAPVDPEQLMARSEVVARHATGALYNAVEHRRIPLRWIWMPLAKVQEGLGGTVRAIMALVTVALTMLVSVLILVPYPLKMDATGKLMPTIRATTYAPVLGQVNEFLVAPTEDVVEDRVLVRMSDPELESKMMKLRSEEEERGKRPRRWRRRRKTPPCHRPIASNSTRRKKRNAGPSWPSSASEPP